MKTKYIYNILQLLLLFGLFSIKVIGQNNVDKGSGISSPQAIITVSTCTYDFPSQLNYIVSGETKAVSLGGGGTMMLSIPTTEDQGQVINLEDQDKNNKNSKAEKETTSEPVVESEVMGAIPSGCMPVVSVDSIWITTSYNSTLQDLFITVSSNSGAPRTGTVDIDGHEITISQAGAPPATPGTISGDATSCYDEIETYSISPVANVTGYTWLVPSGATIITGQNTTQLEVMFGMTSGYVKVKANNSVGSSAYRSKYVSLVSHPYVYEMTGGGNYCVGSSGVPVGLSYSQTGVDYQLTKDGVNIGSPVAGIGSALNFGNQTAGIYRVVATNSTGCSRTMDGIARPIAVAYPIVYSVTGGGSYCSGGSGKEVKLSDSQSGVTYQLKLDGVNTGSPKSGTGSEISFGYKTAIGEYTAVATNSTGCANTMTGSATISINSLPAVYTVTGGGSYCSGGSGVAVGLSDSQTGVTYQLKLNGSTNIGSPIPGTTGNAISFENQTLAGTYTVLAENSSGCTSTTTSSVPITVNSLPTAYTVTGGGSYCSGDEVTGFNVGLSDSQTGVSYQLILDETINVDTILGTGEAIDFGNKIELGSYTVVATNSSECTRTMSGSASIIENQIPEAPEFIVVDTINGVGTVNLSAQPGTDNCLVKWYTSDGDYLTTDTTYSPILSQSTKYYVTTYNPVTGCESPGVEVTATITGIFQYEFINAKSNTKNYFRKVVFKTPVKSLVDIIYLDEEQVYDKVSYVDGLGRTLQTHSMGSTDAGESIIQLYSYDSLGRQDTAFLPFVHESKGFYLDEASNIQEGFYNKDNDKIANDNSPWSTVEYETSPRSRVVEAGAVGENWQLSTGNTVEYYYETNTSPDDAVIQWIYNSANNNYTGLTNYTDNNLFKNTVIDRNGKSATTFTDRDGKTILKDQAGLQTYYVYDLFGRLAHILPPEFVDTLAEVNHIVDTSDNLVKQYCYTYIYGVRGLLIEKHLPGIEPIEYVYDKFKRPVMSRNGNLRANYQWSFVKFDKMGRTIQSGIRTDNGDVKRSSLQVLLFNENDIYETYNPATGEYSSNVTPTNGEIHIENYYDVYHPDAAAYDNSLMPEDTYTTNTLGFLTGTKVKILDDYNNYLTTSIYYNEKGQQIQVIKDNIFGKIDISATKYNFMGQIEKLEVEHTMPDNQIEAITKYYTYDTAGRLAGIEQEIGADLVNDTSRKVKMLEMEYNKLGQVTAKKLHETDDEEFLQTIDYEYNIRGWLTQVNDPDDLITDDLFAMKLYYNQPVNTGAETLYNGMISGIEWTAFGADTVKRAYAYEYDEHYRLKDAYYSESANPDADGRYDVNLTYTANGKINTLRRQGKRDDGVYNLIDDLTYAYNGNKLSRVVDAVNKESIAKDIKHFPDDTNAKSEEYSYDDNGNMVSDSNKKLDSISYNHLNLPELVYFNDTNYIEFVYDATGNKLSKRVVVNGIIQDTINFVGSFIYENSNLAQIQIEEGRVKVEGTTYDYEYFLKDHLGNVRVTFHEDAITAGEAELTQENHYYPYGMRISGIANWSGSNNKLFNGKDLNQEAFDGVDLSWYDYGARNYDPQLGMWFNVDPMAEMYSSTTPYSYVTNNPVNYIDPNGMYKARPSSLWGGNGESMKLGSEGGGGGRGWSYNGGRDNDARDRERDIRNSDDGSDSSFDIWDYIADVWKTTDDEIKRINNNNRSVFGSTEEMVKFALYNTSESGYGIINTLSNTFTSFEIPLYAQSNGMSAQDGSAGGTGGSLTQTAFFSDINDAYRYMWKNSHDSQGNPLVETSAWVINNGNRPGVIVLPNNRNGLGYAYNDFLDVKTTSTGVRQVSYFGGGWYDIIGHIHTHPADGPRGSIGKSDADANMSFYVGGANQILWHNRVWEFTGSGTPVDIGGW